ncbi:hypothetical protein SBOR_6697 [Sclerotinia borealis F-4128]|uniref:Uncharacterized protein n=1 Tax=Sclerotinia borealis (strain F-4128) TaxID=1432307 RepID=W9CDP5_SCLBF|nr:hypothetical protein SBOR_6697 [Sclerotinia borealis F-4128]
MGRKPNPLILQHFERGAKLNDSSNRYQHTCRSCGEKFPKGRLDSLINHIIKKCPAIDRTEKQRLVLEFNNLPELADRTQGQQMNIQNVNSHQTAAINGSFEGMTPLETLAEVSRDMAESEHRNHRPGNGSARGGSQPAMSRGDNLELQEQYTLDNPPMSYESRSQRDKKGINQKGHGNELNLGRSQSASPNSMAATAAAAARFIPSMVDPQLLSEDAVAQDKLSEDKLTRQLVEANAMSDGLFNGSPENAQHSWAMLDIPIPVSQAAAVQAMQVQDQMAHLGQMTYPEHNHAENSFEHSSVQSPKHHLRIAMNPMTTEFSAEYGNGRKATKPNVRGKFNEIRRKEVSDIRRIGSCIRCRMLKKPCTAGEACETCKSVESARLWKTPCIRTRVAHAFELYSAKLHTVLAHHQVLAAKGSATFQISLWLIEVSHFPSTTIYASFPCLEAHDVDTGLTSYILDTDNDDLSTKLESYAKRMMPIFIDNEPSQFIRTTLQTALNVSIQKQDNFLSRALELWTIVHIFVDSEIRWEMSAKAIAGLPDEEGGQTKAILSTERSFATIHTQLNAAAETKASQMCKGILNELERRLLNKASKASFELFLIAVITLNCVEKSTWLFKCWEGEDFHGQWPLEKRPQEFANQGDDLINVLQMILRMRDVPPKIFVRQDNGVLAVDDASEQVIRDFFEQVQLNFNDVHDKQVRHFFDPADSRSYELRYISRLLLPQVPN